MRKSFLVPLAVASLVLVSACGASGGDSDSTTTEEAKATTTTEAEAETVAVDEWAAGFCSDFGTWLEDIQTASGAVGDKVTPGDVESAKTALAELFGSASTTTQTLIASLEEGGAPDIEDGDELVDDLVTKFQGFDDAAMSAQADAEALEVSDAAAFQQDADELTTTFQDEVNTVADSFAEIDTKYPSDELNAALSESCTF
jgi:hypothetical protein